MVKVIILILVLVAAAVVFINARPEEQNPPEQNPQRQVLAPLTSQEAIAKIKNRPEVKKYLAEIPNSRVDLSGTDGDLYLIQVYEIKDGHTATFNWYRVNKNTGTITAEFEFEEETPSLSASFSSSKYGLKFNYPTDWKQNQSTQIFQEGDVITVEKYGPTQKVQTEFYDGARFSVAIPIPTDASLDDWISDPNPGVKYGKLTIGESTFAKLDDYYYAKRGNLIYGFFLFAEGEDKSSNASVLQEILASVSWQP